MPTIRNRFYPLHDIDEHNVINLFSTLVTGDAGTLMKIVTGAANPQNADGWTNTAVGATIAGVFSSRYETKLKMTPTVSGDTRYTALGLSLYSTLEVDENGIPLRYNDQRAREIGAVRSGETVPVLVKSTTIGIWGNYIDQSTSPIQPGFVLCVSRSGNGLLASVDQTSATAFRQPSNTGIVNGPFIYGPEHVVGKILNTLPAATNSGLQNEFSSLGGYALAVFDATV